MFSNSKSFKRILRSYRTSIGIIIIGSLILISSIILFNSGRLCAISINLYYIPIILASFFFGLTGGIFSSITISLITFLMLAIGQNYFPNEQNIRRLIFQNIFFLIGGITSGSLFTLFNINKMLMKNSLKDIAINYTRIMKILADLIENKDSHTLGHSERVAYNSYLIGKKLGLETHRLNNLYWSGLLHDIGKIGILDYILNKPDILTEKEYNEVKRHTTIGYELTDSISADFKDIALGIRHHHEKWNGNGYPDNLSQNTIPLFGRIIAVVDVFEALTSKRPYRKPLKKDEAYQFIKENSGRHFDPNIVDTFSTLYRENLIVIEDIPDFELTYEVPIEYNLWNIWERHKNSKNSNFNNILSNVYYNIMEQELNFKLEDN